MPILLKQPLDKKNYNGLLPGVCLLKWLHFEAYFNKKYSLGQKYSKINS